VNPDQTEVDPFTEFVAETEERLRIALTVVVSVECLAALANRRATPGVAHESLLVPDRRFTPAIPYGLQHVGVCVPEHCVLRSVVVVVSL
jgi:hypothetical protein